MQIRFLFLVLFISNYCFSQAVNDYKAVIIPVKYGFLKSENEFRLSTLTKFNLKNAGFIGFYTNESTPKEFNDKCSLLYVDVVKESSVFITKLFITFKDCNGALIFQSAAGKNKEKDFQVSYTQALNDAFLSVYALNYKYNGGKKEDLNIKPVLIPVFPSVSVVTETKKENEIVENKDSNLLYAQATPAGFQLVDSEPKVAYKIFRTSNATCYIAIKGNLQGVLILKDNQWFFEYYQNDQLITEIINVKF